MRLAQRPNLSHATGGATELPTELFSNSVGFPKPAGPRPETRPARVPAAQAGRAAATPPAAAQADGSAATPAAAQANGVAAQVEQELGPAALALVELGLGWAESTSVPLDWERDVVRVGVERVEAANMLRPVFWTHLARSRDGVFS
jgi:hypothetical protein